MSLTDGQSTKDYALKLLPSPNNGAAGSDEQAQFRPSALAAVAPVDSDVENTQADSNDNKPAQENETLPSQQKKKKKKIPNPSLPLRLATPIPPDDKPIIDTVTDAARRLAAADRLPLSPSHIAIATERLKDLRLAFITTRREHVALAADENEKRVCTAPPRPPYRYEVSEWGTEELTIGPVAPRHWTDIDLDGLCDKTIEDFNERIRQNLEEGIEGKAGIAAIAAATTEAAVIASSYRPEGVPTPGFAPAMVSRNFGRAGVQQPTTPPYGFSFSVPDAREEPDPIMSDRPPRACHPALPFRTTSLGQKPIWAVTIHTLYPEPRAVRIGECGAMAEAMGLFEAYRKGLEGKEIGVYDPSSISKASTNSTPNSKATGLDKMKGKLKGRVTGRMQTREWDGLKEVAKRIGRDMEAGFDTVLQKVGRDGEVEGDIKDERVIMRCWVEMLKDDY